jgi:small-conductance mechanosensitive channel
MQSSTTQWQAWAWAGGALLLSVVLALIGHTVLYRVLWRIARRSVTIVDDAVVRHTRRPTRILLPLLAFAATLDSLPASFSELALVHHLTVIGVIIGIAWTIVALINAAREVVEVRYRIDVADNLVARRVRTQMELLQRVVVGVIALIALAAALMSFPSVRQLGVSLFASAGVAGLVIGMAARPTLGNMIAGMQVAMAQPIRIDDVVVVENEFGRVEEINTTYVVLRLWDERRMIVPLAYFIEKPFTNWTRTGTNLLATVYVYADYRVDVDAVRLELDRVVGSTELWDGRVAILQVTDATERSVQLRALVSASNSSAAWDLRCLVRERLVTFLQRQPETLPRVRAAVELNPPPSPSPSAH